jgi:hypothetical protein
MSIVGEWRSQRQQHSHGANRREVTVVREGHLPSDKEPSCMSLLFLLLPDCVPGPAFFKYEFRIFGSVIDHFFHGEFHWLDLDPLGDSKYEFCCKLIPDLNVG